jgi:hypothetical protein
MNFKQTFTKLLQWEYWPTFMFYSPLVPYFLFQTLKNKSLTFYLNTNPSIHHSGNGAESKFKTLNLIPDAYKPKSILLKEETNIKTALKLINENNIQFPLIAKPDIGFRGYLVKKINNKNELIEYLKKNNSIKLIIQEFITLPNECGIFYHRFPNEKKGKITSITLKKFLTVTGNGKLTLSELIKQDSRAFIYYDLLKSLHKDKINTIIPDKKKITLTVIGNHSKGTQFLNGNHLVNKELEEAFDKINKEIKGWYFGRLDIKYNTFEELSNLKNFKILEINGIIAEPTHIYDASTNNASYLKAIKEIKENWKIITQIANINKEKLGLSDPKLKPYIQEMFFLRKHAKKIKKLTEK